MFQLFSGQEAAEDHPHLDAIIAALGRVQNNGTVVGTHQISNVHQISVGIFLP